MARRSHRAFPLTALVVLAITGLANCGTDPCTSAANEIVAENCLPGSPRTEWDVQGQGDPNIQGFATDISVDQGQTVQFKVRTPSTNYRLDIYRMGYYGGSGARKVATVEPSAALPQTQPNCQNDAATGLVDCGNWAISASWAVPPTAVSGIYFARLVREDGPAGASHVVFIVRDDDGASGLLFQTSDTTWQAYNRYGGTSLYVGGPDGRGRKVSYNRPFITRQTEPEDWVFNSEFPMVRWLERNGYDVSYTTGVDSDRRGAEIREHRAFLSVGHDEYWSGAQRTNVEAARDAGVNLAFFSGNEVFWKTRWEPSVAGPATPHRTLVSYKETHANAKIDPQAGVWTGTWRDARSFNPEGPRPENALTGTLFMVNSGTSSVTVPAEDGKLRLWRGTTVATQQAGQTATLSGGTLGYEWDEDVDNGSRPAGLMRLSSTTVPGVERLQDNGSNYAPGTATHSLTLYRDTNGAGTADDALVFGAGTIQWSWGLDDVHDRGPSAQDVRMQQATVNLLADMGQQPGNRQANLTAATASADVSSANATITSPANGATVQRGAAVTIAGTATDAGGGAVGAVEVSVDGQTWHPATGRADWRYTWTPQQDGPATIRARAADDSGNLQSGPASIAVTVGPGTPATCPCTVFEDGETPAVASEPDTQAVEVGMKLRSDEDGFITGVRFYKGAQNTGTHVGRLWSAGGTQLAQATFTGESATGWQQVTFDSPVAVTRDTTYIASYHAPNGHYAADEGYFTVGKHNPPLHGLASGVDGANGVFRYGAGGVVPTETFNATNYWVDAVFQRTAPPDTDPPGILSLSPADGEPGVDPGARVSVRFDEAMDPASINGSTVRLSRGGTAVAATVSYDAATRTANLTPQTRLAFSTAYTATVAGGPSGVKDRAGVALAADRTWTFTTAAEPPPPPDQGPGGPILVAASAGDPFGRYYAEILRAEGLNAFDVKDLASVTAATLGAYGVVILAQGALTDAQASMLSTWVNGGGNLVAMRPDARLAGLLGITAPSGTLADAYLRVNTGAAPGAGITGQTVQFHGTADRVGLSGATTVATLHSDATTPTTNPAVTLRSVGTAGGQAASFAYDLARSVVQTRQGNPAWAGQERDNQSGPIRSDDLFFPDWVNFSKVAIPQADEQQRLLANLVTHMNLDRAPLPRFWYLPRGEAATVVLTGDDHAAGGTAGQFDRLKAASPAGCSVADWECPRSTSYVYPNTNISDAAAAAYQADGFEIALHASTDCQNYTPASLQNVFASQLLQFAARWPSLAPPATNRTHCIAWSDWATHPKVELANRIRFDTNYYYWPGSWVQDRPGVFTGSGFPQRFADTDGSMIDVYQATTQITDESEMTIPTHIAALLDRALGAEGFYGVFTANMHTDQSNHAGANAIVAAAQSRGVPVVTSRQMLTWLDGRNASSFGSIAFSSGRLTFRVNVGSGARGLEGMVPRRSATGTLSSLTRGGAAVTTTTRTVKGVEYAVFAAAAGDYVATYTGDTTAPAITSLAATGRADGTATVSWRTDEPATSQVRYGTSASSLTGDASDPALVTDHSVVLSGLQRGATYHFRATSADAGGNSRTSPAPPAAPATFTVPQTAEVTIADSTVGEFGGGTTGPSTYVGATGTTADGEVVLRPTVGTEFDGSALPAGWSATPAGGATVSGGRLVLDGARAGTDATYGPGRVLEFVGTFGPAPFQHLGFGDTYDSQPWGMFSTRAGDGLYARTANATTGEDTGLAAPAGTAHRYRVVWTASGFEFFVNGTRVATSAVAVGANMRPLGSDVAGSGTASWDWARMSPYAASGEYVSRVLDSGAAGSDWTVVIPTRSLPAGTSMTFFTRTGSTPTPGAGWSDWQALGGLANVVSPDARYLQYRVGLATTDDKLTPVLESVSARYRPPAAGP